MVRNSLENAVVASENDIIGEEEINNDTVEGNSAIVRFEETMLEEEENPDNETKHRRNKEHDNITFIGTTCRFDIVAVLVYS